MVFLCRILSNIFLSIFLQILCCKLSLLMLYCPFICFEEAHSCKRQGAIKMEIKSSSPLFIGSYTIKDIFQSFQLDDIRLPIFTYTRACKKGLLLNQPIFDFQLHRLEFHINIFIANHKRQDIYINLTSIRIYCKRYICTQQPKLLNGRKNCRKIKDTFILNTTVHLV